MMKGSFNGDLLRWAFIRYQASVSTTQEKSNIQWVSSSSSTKNLLSNVQFRVFYIAFTPTMPFPATGYDSINAVLATFQDVLAQKQQPYGALWCDEGVYHIAKELQLLHENKFKNIILGLRGFHMEKMYSVR